MVIQTLRCDARLLRVGLDRQVRVSFNCFCYCLCKTILAMHAENNPKLNLILLQLTQTTGTKIPESN